MAPLQSALGASRVSSCISGAKAAAASRVVATPSGRRAPTTDAVFAVAAAASASSSSSFASSSEARLTRPEHGGRQLDIPGSSSQARRRSRRAGRNDGFAAGVAVAASASASASAAPSFEQAETSSSSALKEASASPSDAEESRPAPSPSSSSSDSSEEPKSSVGPKQQQQQLEKTKNNKRTSTRVKHRGSGEPIPMDKFARGELVVGRVTSVSPVGARVALLGQKPRVIAFCPAKEMGPPRCVVASAASQAAAAAALSLKLEKKKREERQRAEAKERDEGKEGSEEEEAGAKGEEGEEEASSSSSSGDKEPAAAASAAAGAGANEESKEEAAARKLIKAAKLAASAQPVPSEHMRPGDVRQFVVMYTPKAATYGGVGPAVSARRADEQIMWRRAEAIAAVCKDDSPPAPAPAKSGSGKASSSGSSASSSRNDADDSLAWDEEEAAAAPEASAATAGDAEAAAEAGAAETPAAEAATPVEEEEVAIDEAYLGPDSVLVTITGCNDGGLLTSLAGLPAFIPFSQVEASMLGLSVPSTSSLRGSKNESNSSGGPKRAWLTAATAFPAVGMKVRAVPTEVDAEAERIVLSVRAASELSAREQLRVGALVWGTVRKAASYGLFVGIDGTRESALLHATNVTRGARPPESPLEVLPLGARVRALVVGMDEGGRRLSLSTAEIEENDGDMLVDPEKVYAGAEEQALYFRRHLEALAAQEAAGGGGGGYGGGGGGGGGYGNERRNNNNYNKKGNGGNRGYDNNNNRRNYDDDGDDDGNREWSSG